MIATIIAIAEKCDSSGIMKRSIMDSGISVVRSEDEPRAPGRYIHSLECNNVSQLNQVNREYEPIRVSTPKDYGILPTQVKREIASPRDQGVDDLFISGATTLCTLFKEQESISHQINSSLTDLCVQLVADRASQVKEATPKWHDGDRGSGRGRGRTLFKSPASVTGSQMPGDHRRVKTAAEGHGKAQGKVPVSVSVEMPSTTSRIPSTSRKQATSIANDTLARQGRPVKDLKCFKCGKKRHYQDKCGKGTRCYKTGHMKNDCPYWPKHPIVCWKCHEVGHYHYQCTKVKDVTTQTVPSEDQRRRQPQQQHKDQDGGMRREVMSSTGAVRKVKFAKSPAEGNSVCLKDAAEGRVQQRATPTPIVFSESPQSPAPSPGMVSSPEVGDSSSDYGNPTVAIGVVVEDMTSCQTSEVASQSQLESTQEGATAAVAASVSGGMSDGVQARASATEHQDTPVVAAVTATAATSPAQSNDSLEVQVGENSVRTSPSGTLQQQCIAETCIEWREGPRIHGIPCLPKYLVPKQEVEELSLYELSPIDKVYTPMRTQCCSGAGFHLYRRKWCACKSRSCFSE